MIVLCGSFIGFMERAVLGRKSPLFGRRTAQIFLRPFPYTEAAEFHARCSLSSKAMVYFICDGIPLYRNYFNSANSVEKNIEDNLLNVFSPLFREPDFLLREELRDDNWTDLCECKWGQIRSQKQLFAELDRKVPAYPNPRNATIGRRIFLNKISPRMDTGFSDMHWHCLEDLYR